MHNNSTDLLRYIPKECVPSDFSGSDKSIEELGGMFTIINNNMCLHLNFLVV